MTEYIRLLLASYQAHTIEVEEIATGKRGVANPKSGSVAVFYGADDGSDDAVISEQEFNDRFRITAVLLH